MAKVDLVHQKVELLLRNNERIREYTQAYSTQSLATEANRIASSVDVIIQENAEMHKTIKGMIDRIKTEVSEEEKRAQECEPTAEPVQETPEYRMKRQICGTLVGQFQDVLKQTNKMQAEFKKAVQLNIKNQLRIGKIRCHQASVANPKLTEEELDKQVADPEQGKFLLNEQILGVHEKVKSTIKDIQDKYKAILELEKVRQKCDF